VAAGVGHCGEGAGVRRGQVAAFGEQEAVTAAARLRKRVASSFFERSGAEVSGTGTD
jgi:hypothetical protein